MSWSSFLTLATLPIAIVSATPTTWESSTLFDFEKIQLDKSALQSLSPAAASLVSFNGTSLSGNLTCKNFPSDTAWPSESSWNDFNSTVGGALIKTIPIGAVCFSGDYYNADQCAYVVDEWNNSTLHMDHPSSMMSPLYQGLTCEPTVNVTGTCTIGGFPTYVVNVSTVSDIQATVNMARNSNIRLVIKNTGHDFMGKSGGAGALSVWTHHLKDLTFFDSYNGSANYSGPAVKVASGIQAWEINEAAAERNLVVVGGEGKTVGVFGGYILGGGHSPLSSIHGMAADSVLAMEVVTADGYFLTASETENTDLFWALRGGGGSTYGIVTSMVVKAYPTMPVTTVAFSFASGGNITTDTFFAGIRAYFDYHISLTEAGIYCYFQSYTLSDGISFNMMPVFAPGLNKTQTLDLLNPWFTQLSDLGISITPVVTEYTSFHDAWTAAFPLESVAYPNDAIGSRLFPRSNWEEPASLNATFDAYKSSLELGLSVTAFLLSPTLKAGNSENSVNPAWRNTLMHTLQSVIWDEDANSTVILAKRAQLTKQMDVWRNASVGAGAYFGEGDRNEPHFQQSFFGSNYERLLAIKQEWDPENVFWARNAVGSEVYNIETPDTLNDENGRLCKA